MKVWEDKECRRALAKDLRNLLKAMGITQTWLAKRMHISRQAMYLLARKGQASGDLRQQDYLSIFYIFETDLDSLQYGQGAFAKRIWETWKKEHRTAEEEVA
jgi:transcriptional regulator with XRE-family HTH domain